MIIVKTSIVRAALVEYFQEKAEWREQVAEEHPHDTRNVRSAQRLRRVAAYVAKLPGTDSLLRKIASKPAAFPGGDVFQAPIDEDGQSTTDEEASRCGFHDDGRFSAARWFKDWATEVLFPELETVAEMEPAA